MQAVSHETRHAVNRRRKRYASSRLPSLFDNLEQSALAMAADRVMWECSFTDNEIRGAIVAQLRLEGTRCESAGVDMAQAWLDWVGLGEFHRHSVPPAKFFSQGHWKNQQGWPLDHEALRRQRLMSVGCSR